jgi:hypothetical protein
MESEPLIHLKELIETTEKNTENDCGKLLADHFCSILLPLEGTIVFTDKEYITESGRTDIIVIGLRIELDGTEERVAYVWELKAPQVWVFEKETNSRVRPSDELYSAENQLLQYHSDLAGSETFRTRWNIPRRENIKIGGIIIGRQARFVRCVGDEFPRLSAIARTALSAREQAFYKGCGLRLWTWDTILQTAPRLQQSHLQISVSEQIGVSG